MVQFEALRFRGGEFATTQGSTIMPGWWQPGVPAWAQLQIGVGAFLLNHIQAGQRAAAQFSPTPVRREEGSWAPLLAAGTARQPRRTSERYLPVTGVFQDPLHPRRPVEGAPEHRALACVYARRHLRFLVQQKVFKVLFLKFQTAFGTAKCSYQKVI